MGHRKQHAPRHGSLAFLPRKRAAQIKGRIKNWRDIDGEATFLGFCGFKAGMSHITYIDDYKNSSTYGRELMKAVTIIDAPPLLLIGIRVYNQDDYGKYVVGDIYSPEPNEYLLRKIKSFKLENYNFMEKKKEIQKKINPNSEIFGIFQTQPNLSSVSRKKPDIVEIKVSGLDDPEEAFNFALKNLGKEIRIRDIFRTGELIDVIAVTKGKGFQGPVKRFGITILTRKNSKVRRAVACIGPWHPARVLYTVPRPGQMGFHQRTEYHKRIFQIGENGEEINPKGGFIGYGLVKGDYIMVLGSIPGPKKRMIRLRKTIRPTRKYSDSVPEIVYINRESQQLK